MDGGGISIIERPPPVHNYDTPNAAHHAYHPKTVKSKKVSDGQGAPAKQFRGVRAEKGDIRYVIHVRNLGDLVE